MERILVDARSPQDEAIRKASAAILAGHVVIVATDTLYGLSVDPHNPAAVEALFELKRRAANQPMPLVASDMAQVERWAGHVTAVAKRLAERFWPGPLTLIVDGWPELVPAVHGGSGGVGVRVPDHAVTRALARAAGRPLAATSANPSGQPPTAEPDRIAPGIVAGAALFLDSGPAPGGLPSTIVDTRGTTPVLVRAGVVPWNRVLESL
jgi:L-threonylcarbamoyladenylate synthase